MELFMQDSYINLLLHLKYEFLIYSFGILKYSQDGRVNAFYSTPSIYTDAKYAANEEWPLKFDDFFP